jgi:hypothetical protein
VENIVATGKLIGAIVMDNYVAQQEEALHPHQLQGLVQEMVMEGEQIRLRHLFPRQPIQQQIRIGAVHMELLGVVPVITDMEWEGTALRHARNLAVTT